MLEPTPARPTQVSLETVARVFLWLGVTSFGGPAAHIAMMEQEVVRRRGWVSREEFLDLLGAANLIPGPNSTELAIHIGHRVAGWAGLMIAGACFILPAVVIVTMLGWVYQTYGQLPSAAGILYGVKPVVIALVVQALVKLGRTSMKTWLLVVVAIGTLVLAALKVHELVVLFGAGLLLVLIRAFTTRRPTAQIPLLFGLPPSSFSLASTTLLVPFGLWPLFLVFLKIGSVLFGSGYVLLAFLRNDLVERRGWLTEQQLLDAVAVGQVTPGPVFTTATFIGYLLDGPAGAAVATAGIFLPAFVFVALSVPLLPRLRKSPVTGAFLDGVNAASLALMALVTWELGRTAVVDVLTTVLAVASTILLLLRVNSTWLVLAGALFGLLHGAIPGTH